MRRPPAAVPRSIIAAMNQDELKALVGRAALAHVVPDALVGVGTGSTVNQFIDALKVGETSLDSPIGTDVTRFLESLSGCFQEGFSSTDYTTALNLFTSGQAAMYYMGTWELRSFLDDEENLKPEFSYFTMPTWSTHGSTCMTISTARRQMHRSSEATSAAGTAATTTARSRCRR